MKKFFQRLSIDFGIEKTWEGSYKRFNIFPTLLFIKDTQCISDLINLEGKGFINYEIWFDLFIWQSYIELTIKNK